MINEDLIHREEPLTDSTVPEQSQPPLVRQLQEDEAVNKQRLALGFSLMAAFLVFYGLGLGLFWLKSRLITSKANLNQSLNQAGGSQSIAKLKPGQVYGSDDPIFKDTAEGLLEVNKNDDKPGSHILIRGDESQTAYLISSVLDLNQFVNHKVKIWGETQAVREVGWFLDVGRLQILE